MTKDLTILNRLNNAPVHSKKVVVNIPVAVLVYVEISGNHFFYIMIEKKEVG